MKSALTQTNERVQKFTEQGLIRHGWILAGRPANSLRVLTEAGSLPFRSARVLLMKGDMNPSSAGGSEQGKPLAWQRCDQLMNRVNGDEAIYELALRIYWFILGIACTVLGTGLFMILEQ